MKKVGDKVLLGLCWWGFGVWGGAGGQQKVDFGVKIWWGRPRAAWGCEKGTEWMFFLGMAVSGGVSAPGEAHLTHKRVLPGGESVI